MRQTLVSYRSLANYSSLWAAAHSLKAEPLTAHLDSRQCPPANMRWLALATLASALVPPHRPRPVRTRVYKLPQETVDLKFRAKGLLDDVKRNLEEGAEMPDSAEKLRKAYVTDVSSRRPPASSACVHRAVAARRRCLRTSASMASRWHRPDAVDATRPQRIEREHSPMCATQQTSSPRRRPT